MQESLRKLKEELVSSLADVEEQLEQLGGSASTVSRVTARSVATAKSAASLKPPSTIAEES